MMGKRAVISGKMYETLCQKACMRMYAKSCRVSDIAGSSSKRDLTIDSSTESAGIEIKRFTSPSWGETSIKINNGFWVCSNRPRPRQITSVIEQHANECDDEESFLNLLNSSEDLKGYRSIADLKDSLLIETEYKVTLDSDHRYINDYYISRGVNYIQIEKKGLYRLGSEQPLFSEDIPLFQRQVSLRFRVKKNRNSRFSAIAVFSPMNLSKLEKSPYSIDGKNGFIFPSAPSEHV
jgi:hypothetical protein